MTSYLEFKLNVNLRLVKSDFMQSTAVNLEFKLKVIFKFSSCNRPLMFYIFFISAGGNTVPTTAASVATTLTNVRGTAQQTGKLT